MLVLALLGLALFVAPGPVAAALPGDDCTTHLGQMASPIRFKGYENANFTGKVLCVHVTGAIGFAGTISLPNFKNYNAGAYCSLQGPASINTWNDCISSYKWDLACTQRLLVYRDASYVNQADIPRWGVGSWAALGNFNDQMSSLKITEDPNLC